MRSSTIAARKTKERVEIDHPLRHAPQVMERKREWLSDSNWNRSFWKTWQTFVTPSRREIARTDLRVTIGIHLSVQKQIQNSGWMQIRRQACSQTLRKIVINRRQQKTFCDYCHDNTSNAKVNSCNERYAKIDSHSSINIKEV